MNARSLSGRLALGLALVAGVGAVALLVLVALEYVVGAEEPLSPGQLAFEVADHVVAPLIILLSLVAISGAVVIRSALRPLERAAREVDAAARAGPRGVRIDHGEFPAEAKPFAAAINRLLERLDAAAEAQEAFAADAAHELKTPIAILSLELDRLPDEAAAAMREDIASLSRLVDQLLLLARLDAQAAAETPKTEIALEVMAREVISTMAPFALRAGRNLAMEDAGPSAFEGHQEAIAAALRNLIENGLRATPEGGTVTVIAGPGASLTVRDEGPGISPEQLARLSRRGERADYASASGAGLGLAIVQRIMAAHHGALRTRPERREIVLDFAVSGEGEPVQAAS